ncbi:class I SAM-dependent methyltransferase [Brevibacterium sediminis]|uniref:SAM-dependent methyltransferase n=2 Tax=Brevibacterium TaxID=1696 RepID=A0A5C4X3D1_9MICO|nr:MULTISPECIES: class I SAM-dependent methyltransferase [Brevibacterium]MCS4592568.1 class I SAM-dependent methyltransferase [Brevibacterium sediminis]TNM54840.1 class I SAM-dependent methyltransferase [Brevibacterium sediminis]GGC31434.1 SAM-dependent methyltransferase [Brevibacterium sediminis]
MSFDHQWNKVRRANPDHSANYAQRWRDLAAAGHDIGGEARFVNAMAPRGSRILDAGCGTGRAGGLLIDEGHTVFGVDLDEFLISVAEEDFPSGEWHTGDLADFDFAGAGITEIDVAFCAGNVLSFLDPASRRQTLGNIKSTLKHGGRFVSGFGAGRGYDFDDFIEDVKATGMFVDQKFSTWELRPFEADSDFLVLIAERL